MRLVGRFVCTWLFFAVCLPVSIGHADDDWLQIESENFVVTTNAGEKSGRRLVEELEAVRVVFRVAIRGLPQGAQRLDVLAAKDEESFETLIPQIAAEKKRFVPSGVFFRTPDKPWIIVNLDARGDNRYAPVYHEYFHSLALPAAPRAPLWFHEGMASMWENTEIRSKDVTAARPSQIYLEILANESLMDLRDLLLVNHASPAYRQAHRASIFYAQSWALMHFIFLSDKTTSLSQGLGEYLTLLDQNHEPVDAFEQAFGPLEVIDSALRNYVRHRLFNILRIEKPAPVDDTTLRVTTLSPGQINSLLGSYLAHTGQYEDALALIGPEPDEKDPVALESLGIIHFRRGQFEEARESFRKAATLDPARCLLQFYLATIAASVDDDVPEAISLYEGAVNANPFHAPSLSRLAILYGANGMQLELALGMARRAAVLLPDDAVSSLAVGIAARASGMNAEALAAFERALQLDPSMETAQSQLDELRAQSEPNR